tara:strand:+ start:370 stop:873 length:504 start_codon:yes stop_codon:yes gene_type:complete
MKDILTEQLIGLPALSSTGAVARTGFNLSKGGPTQSRARIRPDAPDWDNPELRPEMGSYSSKEKIQKLFKTARTWKSTTADWKSVKSIARAMRDEMSGVGSGDTLQFLKKIKTKPQLAALVKNFSFNGDDLYDWLSAEYAMSWDSVVKALSAFKSDMPQLKSPTMYA